MTLPLTTFVTPVGGKSIPNAHVPLRSGCPSEVRRIFPDVCEYASVPDTSTIAASIIVRPTKFGFMASPHLSRWDFPARSNCRFLKCLFVDIHIYSHRWLLLSRR